MNKSPHAFVGGLRSIAVLSGITEDSSNGLGRQAWAFGGVGRMGTDEVQTVLTNWIEQALSPTGSLPEGVFPASWVVTQFAVWCRERASETMADADRAASAVVEELTRLSGWESFGETLHEMIDVGEAKATCVPSCGCPKGLASALSLQRPPTVAALTGTIDRRASALAGALHAVWEAGRSRAAGPRAQ